ncbi:MAG: hypothetical protein KIT36_19205 [Alphaproteobacteria bacterium]|nr:hypothetical protein [Alphaproteobacteria bacterium]
MPSRGWYVVAAVVLVAAVVAAVWLAVARVGGMQGGLTQIVVPGSADLELTRPGTYTIFHERTSQVDGRIFSSSDISGLRVAVRSVANGRAIAVRRPTGSTSYNFSGRSGQSVLAFDIDAPGTYRLTAGYDDGRTRPQAVLAVGTGFVSGLLATIALSFGIALAGVAVAMVIFIVVLLKRRRALQPAPAPVQWPGRPPGW